ncbi:hypothetical protein JTB14_010869 [Gonioctena quinquepunctata]|nr:hypothetical protein JTB14_010869 [Gonioctena quinquepunctata]
MIFSDIDKYDKCSTILNQHKVSYHTFNRKEPREIRAIFEGVAVERPAQDIHKELIGKGFHPRVVDRFSKQDGSPMSIILVIVPNSDQEKKKLSTIMDIDVRFEYQRKKKKIGQCYNCQKFGHSAAN